MGSRPQPSSPKLLHVWAEIRDSLWFVPGLGALLGVAGAALILAFPLPERLEDSWLKPFLFSGEIDSARGVLGTIAGSLITVTGVVFSVTIVTLQLASTQFTPRVMRGFIADRTNQSVLAIFIGTFTYTLIVLGALGSPAYGDDGVPVLAVTFSLLLLLVSVGALIMFINRAARSAQISMILAREVRQALTERPPLFPAGIGSALPDHELPIPASAPAGVKAPTAGYVEAVDGAALLQCAERQDLLLEMRVSIGEFVFPGKELMRAWPATRVTRDVESRIQELFVVGSERTPDQDMEFSIVAIADIGVKALSSGINDPTTALLAIDRLTQILAAVSGASESRLRASADGKPRLITRSTTFERASGLAFDQLRVHGGANPAIVKKILDSILELLPLVNEEEAAVLRAQADLTLLAAREECSDHDLPAIEELAERVLSRV
jgi:uncharacterized membrane protein